MSVLIVILLLLVGGAIWFFFPRLVIFVIVSCLLSWWLCDINPEKTYSWYSGIWHGWFFIGNLIRSFFGNALYKAANYTTAYNMWWWISTACTVVGFLFGGRRSSY